MHLEKLYNKYAKKLAELGGQLRSIYRPDYTASDQSGKLIAVKKYRVGAGGKPFAKPSLPGVMYFNVIGDRSIIQVGDVLIEQDGNISSLCTIIQPPSREVDAIAVMTDRLGQITDDVSTVIFDNVRFSYIGTGFPGSALNEKMAGSLGIPSRKAMLFTRESLTQGIDKGMRLIEKDSHRPYRWRIVDITIIGYQMVLTLDEDVE